jgi:DNA polymerase-1
MNLCRAYIPFKCIHYRTGEWFDYRTKESRSRWEEVKEDGTSAWIVPETNEPWIPTDMHSETTHNALVILGYTCHEKYKQYTFDGEGPFGREVDKAEFKRLRGRLGKRYNFSKTYGVGIKTTMESLNVSEEVANALSTGYETAFPGLIAYQKAIEKAHAYKGYIVNAYGMRYYLENASKSYKLANHNIQGSCALALKKAIILLDKYILDNKLKSRLVLPVHDEQIIGIVKGEKKFIPTFVEIMQSVFDSWCLIPIVSEPEVSATTWAEKESYV